MSASDSSDHALLDDLQVAMRRLRHLRPARSVAGGLTPSERHLLLSITTALEGGGGLRPSDIAANTRLSPQALSPALRSLEDAGYITRRASTTDRRAVYVELTEQGRALADEVGRVAEEQLRGLIEQMGERDTRRFIELVDVAARYFSETGAGEKHG